MFGCDPFNHTRIHLVAISLINVYQELEQELDYEAKLSVSTILDKLETRSKSEKTKKYLEVFTTHLNTPLVQLPEPVREVAHDAGPAESRDELASAVTETEEDKSNLETELVHMIESIHTPPVNTYLQFLDLHNRIMQCVDQILSQEIECMLEVDKDMYYRKILGFKEDLRVVENEDWYPSLGRLQVIILRNQLKLAFDELSGFREDYAENTRKLFEKSAREFWQKHHIDDDDDWDDNV